ncbi:MAG: response regulator [Magnetococcales bacterium]|nr:response regulator [Magnetococcales bacterium]
MKKILIIDDDPDCREGLKNLLERAGYAVEVAEDGLEGMATFRNHPADVVITDIIMPRMDGLETIRAIRTQKTDQPHIIAISGGSLHLNPSFSLKSAGLIGADRALEKPFSREQLIGAIEGCIDLEGSESTYRGHFEDTADLDSVHVATVE